jgi:hypothetical protein
MKDKIMCCVLYMCGLLFLVVVPFLGAYSCCFRSKIAADMRRRLRTGRYGFYPNRTNR